MLNKLNKNPLTLKIIHSSGKNQFLQQLLCISIYAAAMGFLEAICVVYLRQLIDFSNPNIIDALAIIKRFPIEHVREACTLIMLFTMAWAAGFNWRVRTANFFYMFGLWDIIYYLGLKIFDQWPSSLLEWDCLFLIPKPWYGPVLAPILISCYFILFCYLVMIYEYSKLKIIFSIPVILSQIIAFIFWYYSFVKDSNHIISNGYTGITYSWFYFICGLITGILGIWILIKRINNQKLSLN
jgi:hypothetical protein